MKTKLISLTWRGTASVDPRFSAAMLSWSVADICTRDTHDKLSVGIENGQLEAYNCDFEQQFGHHIKYVVGLCRVIARRTYAGKTKYADFAFIPGKTTAEEPFMCIVGPEHGFVYLLKDPRDPLLHIHFFEGDNADEMTELLHQMRDPSQPLLGGSTGSIPSSFIAPNNNSNPSLATAENGKSSNTAPFQSGAGTNQSLRQSASHATPATNLKLTEAVRTAQHDGSPTVMGRMSGSKSYTAGLNHSAGTVAPAAGAGAGGRAMVPPTSASTANLLDISPNNTQFFEVMYVGKIKVSHKRVPFSFIDDALPKFKAYDAQKVKAAAALAAASAATSVTSSLASSRRNSNTEADAKVTAAAAAAAAVSAGTTDDDDETVRAESAAQQDATDVTAHATAEAASDKDADKDAQQPFDGKIINTRLSEENKENSMPLSKKLLLRGQSQVVLPVQFDQSNSLPLPPPPPKVVETVAAEAPPKLRDRSASIGAIPVPVPVEQNRTMVFLIGKSDLRLISPDRKQVLLYKDFKDVASCAQGHRNADHFGIICREPHTTDSYIGYVFKCQSDAVADDIVGSISQAFHTCAEQKTRERNQIFSCEHCPMLWYHKLCSDIEGLSEKKTQTLIFRRVELLSEEEQTVVMAKYYGAEEMAEHGLAEQNQFMMMLLRAHCESRQQRHVHDTAENRSEFLNQYLGGSTIFMKAKRSLTSSFDHLLKRKNSKDDVALAARADQQQQSYQQLQPVDNASRSGKSATDGERSETSSNGPASTTSAGPAPARPRAASVGVANFGRQSHVEPLKSPMMDIFIKVGNSPKDPQHNPAAPAPGSWRQEILSRVVTPSKKHDKSADAAAQFMSPRRQAPGSARRRAAATAAAGADNNGDSSPTEEPLAEKRTTAELRQLWRTAIRQTILLRRMEKENARLQERHNEHELKKIKLDYDEIIACGKQCTERWETLIDGGADAARISNKQDPRQLLQAIKAGVPRSKRGEVWSYLAEQYSMNTAPVDVKLFPNFNTPYKVLLKSLTEHQHAIFIDLGRTFPNHTYYKAALGIGQLSLFNILKAYSILDPELGYCQGLGFICGVLLLHCDEEEAFNLLKHLMFRRQMRTKYLPDMRQFQLQLYQLSRLIRDHCPNLYAWLDQNEVSPTLYAAPWILTVFSSQFPLGFVTRVFDLLFLESPEVIFKVSIALLDVHQEELLQRDGFEEIMDYLKNVVPKVNASTLEAIQKKIFSMDIRKQLAEYQVEYNVLQEELTTTNHHLESLRRTRETNKHLETQLQFAQSSIAQLETTRHSQQAQIQTLQSQVQSLDVTVYTLGLFVAQLAERHSQIDLPGDIRRICQQVVTDERRTKKLPIFVERKIGKSMSVNSQLGFPLKVLEEMNENPTHSAASTAAIASTAAAAAAETSPKSGRPAGKFFENTYQKIRQQQQARPQRLLENNATVQPSNGTTTANASAPAAAAAVAAPKSSDIRLPEYVERAIQSMSTARHTATDSGISTPVSPPLSLGSALVSPAALSPSVQRLQHMQQRSISSGSIAVPASSVVPESPSPYNSTSAATAHPLSNCEDVHFTFNGTTQLKSVRSTHQPQVILPQQQQQLNAAAESDAAALPKNGRS